MKKHQDLTGYKSMTDRHYLPVIILFAFLFSFWRLGSADLNEWDESEYGQNAFEMLHNGDYIHYNYAGAIDSWNAKPPLSVWLITIAYRMFGFNAFALRFFSALSSALFFIVAYKLVRLYARPLFSFGVCLLLLSCKAIIGFHIGRTGDADSLLVLFTTAFIYNFLRYADFKKNTSVYYSAIFLGLAFYAKGTAAFLPVPGMIIYLLINRKMKSALLSWSFLRALIISIIIIFSWIVLLMMNGQQFAEGSKYGSKSVLETLFMHDTINRLTDPAFPDASPDRMFIFRYLDVRFNVWNYLFYLSLFMMLINPARKKIFSVQIVRLALCLVIPVIFLLTFSTSKHDWYPAPIALFISILIIHSFRILIVEKNYSKYVIGALFAFTLVRQFLQLNNPRQETLTFFENNRNYFEHSKSTQLLHIPSQDYFLYLSWYSNSILINSTEILPQADLIFYDNRFNKIPPSVATRIECKNMYCLALRR